MNVGLMITAIVILIVMSAYFSATETAFSSLNRIRVKSQADAGDKKSQLIISLADRYDELLSSILVGNNIVNISCTSIATVLFTYFIGNGGATVSTVVMTILVLTFGEITPKSLAKENPERFAAFSAPIMAVLMKILLPISKLFMLIKSGISKLFPHRDGQERAITEDELMTYVDEAEDDGGIDEHESALIRNAIEFHDRDVSEILTPRVDISAIEDTATPEEIARIYDETGYSRLPVYQDSIDNIIGVLHERDFYSSQVKGNFELSRELGRVLYVQGGLKISALMRRLQLEKLHMAIVLDEFGGTLGLVTLEDVIEELVGEIWDEHDEVIEFFMPQEDGSTLVNAGANLEDLFEHFDWGDVPEDTDSVTAGGWAIEQFGFIPQAGSAFIFDSSRITVTKADKRHVLELKVEHITPDEAQPQSQSDNEDSESHDDEEENQDE